ncbi:MAG: UPF0175 family protein [Methanobacteriaceae archaeon]|nr:UPF0175 family protein [Methanobacteriaceae archaeon]
MGPVKAEVNLPSSFLANLKIKKDQSEGLIKRSLAVELYREGELSLGKSAELAGLNRWEMILLLNEKHVPIDYTADDAIEDLENLKKVLGP